MATDFAFAAFLIPVLLGIGALFFLAFFGKPPVNSQTSFLGLGRVRLARGYLGATLATLICTAISATQLAFNKVALRHITNEELGQLLPGYILYFFILAMPFVLFGLTIVGLPALAALRKMKAMTVLWVAAAAVLFSAAMGVWTMLSPHNQWCSTHLLRCGSDSALFSVLFTVPVVVGFALAARVPFRISANAT